MATQMPSTAPTISSHMGTRRFFRSMISATSATITNAARMTTPQVITDPKLVSSSAKRSGLCRPALASNINSTRPTMTTIGAIQWPSLRMVTASGWRQARKAEVANAPPPRPPRNR